MPDQPDLPQPPSPENPVQFGPTRAVLTIFDFNPPAVVFLDARNNAVATMGIPEHLYESVRIGLATALGPLSTPPTPGIPRHDSEDASDQYEAMGDAMDEGYRQLAEHLAAERGDREQSRERGKSKGKGKGKKKGHDKQKGKPDWAGDPDHPDHPRNRKPEKPEKPEPEPDEPADEIPVEPLPDVIDPESLEPMDGDVDVRDPEYEPVTVLATADVVPALFEQWYSDKYDMGEDSAFPDPALHPDLVREYLNDTKA